MGPDIKRAYQVQTGRHVKLEMRYQSTAEVEVLEVDIVPDAEADFERGFLGESTPLAKAIAGLFEGDIATYQAGDRVRVRVLEVYPELRGLPEDLSERRAEAEREAVRQADETSAILFASSFSGKWGDYDPNAVPKEETGDEEERED